MKMLLGSVQISGERMSRMEMEDICVSLQKHKVRLLALRDCRTGDEEFSNLAQAVGECKSILQLNLNLGIVNSGERAKVLKTCLVRNRSLSSLFLHGSPLTDKGVRSIAHGLALHPNIVSLDLGDCQISDATIPLIADLLPSNGAKRGLQDLTLSANPEISASGWSTFFISMAYSCSLKTLNLDYNRLGDYGIGCLAVVLASNRTLQAIDLEGCEITEFGGQVLLHLITNFPVSLQELVLGGNQITKKMLQAISSALEVAHGSPAHQARTRDKVSVEISGDTEYSSIRSSTSEARTMSTRHPKSSSVYNPKQNTHVIIREPYTADSHAASRRNCSSAPAKLHSVIKTYVESATEQTETETDCWVSPERNARSSNYYSSSPSQNKGSPNNIQSSSRNTYDSMSTREAVHAAYRKALDRRNTTN